MPVDHATALEGGVSPVPSREVGLAAVWGRPPPQGAETVPVAPATGPRHVGLRPMEAPAVGTRLAPGRLAAVV